MLHHRRRQPHNPIAEASEIAVTTRMRTRTSWGAMDTAVNLDDELARRRQEVSDVAPNGHLTPKPHPQP